MVHINAGRKFYIATTAPNGSTPEAQGSVLNQTAFEALDWTEVQFVGSIGQTGLESNILTYNTLGTTVAQKGKGIANAGDPDIEVAREPTDPGQIAMRVAGKTRYFYAFKIEDADAPDVTYSNTIYYNRGLVSGPFRPNGRNEDFILETFRLALVQDEIVVDPELL